ncbi:MAG: N-acetylmuramoyl-L-alanine amidase, partial [Duodenibacillus sp.]|nr:N-acetylmuramoyl-L-alanine amidase [Duodenibacillus sp.]
MTAARRSLLLGAGGLLACPSLAWAAEALQMRIGPDEGVTRVTLESARRLRYSWRLLTASSPLRFMVDAEGLPLGKAAIARLNRTLEGDRFVARVRAAENRPGVVRIVFELKRPVQPVVQHKAPSGRLGWRLAVEFMEPNNDIMGRLVERTAPKQSAPAPARPARPRPAEKAERAAEPEAPARKPRGGKSGRTETLVVVIDPGHGGVDPGAIGRGKTREKTVALAISRKLAAVINGTPGMKAVLTRNRDVFLPLARRAQVAVRNNAHLFVSIHADAWIKPDARGSSVFTLSIRGASSLQARWLAQTQNQSDEIGGTMFKDVAEQARSAVVDLLAETKLRYGMQLGAEVLRELGRIGPLHRSGVESAQFAVLKAQGIPSILVETAFISNPDDERLLRSPKHQARLAGALYRGIAEAVRKD